MQTANLDPTFSDRALARWREYERTHDLRSLTGQVAAIDPDSGRVWIEDSAAAIAARMDEEGAAPPVYLIRIGYPSYVRKGRR
jgi:hypothetical protein